MSVLNAWMWELLRRRVTSATTSSLRDRLRRPARAVFAGDHAGQSRGRTGSEFDFRSLSLCSNNCRFNIYGGLSIDVADALFVLGIDAPGFAITFNFSRILIPA